MKRLIAEFLCLIAGIYFLAVCAWGDSRYFISKFWPALIALSVVVGAIIIKLIKSAKRK